jgi:ribose transport system ATP-binding protein
MQDAEGDGTNLLILDEPTSSLPTHEVEVLLGFLRRYSQRGEAILYVSHRLDEVLAIADRITVLRDGQKVGTFDRAELDEDRLIELIVGRAVDRVFPPPPEVRDETPILELRDLCAGRLRDLNMTVAAGEIVGIAGLLGSGRSQLLRALFGQLPVSSGAISLDGSEFRPRRAKDAMKAGVALVPENRIADGILHDQSVAMNISFANVRDYWRRGHMASHAMRRDARALMSDFQVKAASERDPIATLSGGNQQKVVLARWLRRQPRLLLLDEPTHGVDVGARAEIYGLVRKAVAAGASALVVASDFEELAHVSDRVLTFRDGRIIGELRTPNITADRLTQMLYRPPGQPAET